MSVTTDVIGLYVSLFNRAPDADGLAYWIGRANGGATNAQIALEMSGSPESLALYPVSMSNSAFIAAVYQNVFGRAGDADGLAYWTAQIGTNGQTKSSVLADMLYAGSHYTAGMSSDPVVDAAGVTSAALLNNKIAVGDYFANTLASNDTALAAQILALVTANPTSVVTAEAAAVSAAGAGTTPLTSSTDLLTGTYGNDTYTATSATLNAADVINGGGGTDTMNVTLTAAGAAATISSVENINVNWDAFGTATVDATNITGATITVSSSKLGYLGGVQVDGAGNNTIVSGSGTIGTLDVNGGKSVVVDGGVSKIITVDGTATAANNLSATVTAGAATTTVTVGAAQAFKTTTVTGGAATTAITVHGSAGTTDVANITVSKDATVSISTAVVETLNITAADGNKVTLGAGALLDKATVTSTGAVTLVAAGDDLTGHTLTNAATGGLTIDYTSDATADDLSKVQFSNLNMKAALASNLTVASGAVITAGIDIGAAADDILTGTGTADTLTLNVSADQTNIVSVIDGTNDVETLTVNANAGATNTDGIVSFAQLDAKAVVLTGASKVTLTKFNATSIDASAVTGNFTATQDVAAATTVVGSATATNNVTLTATTQTTAYTGGEGADTVVLAQTTGNSTTVLGNGTNTYTNTSLTDGTAVVLGGTGVDTITITATDSGANTSNVAIQSGDGADVITLSLASANKETASVDLGAGDDSFTFANALTATDVLAIEGGDGTDTLNLNGKDLTDGSITLSNVEVLWDSAGNATVDGALLTGKTFTIKGDGSIATLLDVDLDAAGTYNFSGLVLDATLTKGIGGLNITGNAGADTITGTAGNDTIATSGGADFVTGGAGVDSMTAGGAVDTFIFAAGDSGTTTATADSITTFTTTADKLDFNIAAGSAVNYVEDLTNAASMAAAKTNADTAMNGTVRYYFQDDGVDGYLFVDMDGDGTADLGVKLMGVVDIAFGDIIA